jgi:hypothetical protein
MDLPGLVSGLDWRLSFGSDEGGWASFAANERSPIRNVYLTRREGVGDTPRINTLAVIFNKGRCPTTESVEAVFGTFRTTMIPPPHLTSPDFAYRSLDLTASDGRNVHVSIDGDNCVIRFVVPYRP